MGEIQDEIQQLKTLIEINALINSEYRDVNLLLSRIMESAGQLINSEAASLLLLDRGTDLLYFEVVLGDKGDEIKRITMSSGEGIAGWVLNNKRSLIVNDVKNDPRHYAGIDEEIGYRTRNLIAVPLRVRDEVIGVLEVINKSGGGIFKNEDVYFLEVLADQAAIAIQNAQTYERLENEVNCLRQHFNKEQTSYKNFIWISPLTGRLLEQADKMAKAQSPVLILGESGTGKEHIAERIHQSSNVSGMPLVRVNCAAIPQELMESELFGYVKGAFTDAIRDKSGVFERADGGTLFLDEVTELNDSAQAKLLRVLQNGRFQRVGGEVETQVNVRVIAASNRNIDDAIIRGDFRRDLYYRLAVLILEVPPLRDRPDDIEALAKHFLAENFKETPDSPKEFSLNALEVLLSYRWPGNVRELHNAVERAAITSRGSKVIQAEDLAIGAGSRAGNEYRGKTLKESMLLFKKNFVREILRTHSGHQTTTAKALGIQRTYLSRLIKELSINTKEENSIYENP